MKRRSATLLATLAAFLLLGGGCAYFNTLYNAKLKYREAQEMKERAEPDREQITNQEERLYTEAFEKAAKVVKFYPNSKWVDDALLLMGMSSLEKGDYSTALRKFDEILTFFPDSDLAAEALLMQGRTLVETKDYAAAVETLTRASEFDKKDLRDDVTYFLGRVQYEQGNHDQALAAFAEVVERHKKSEWFSASGLLAGEIALERGDADLAVSFFDKVWNRGRSPEDRFRGGMRKGQALLDSGLSPERARNTFHDVADQVTNDQFEGEALLKKGEALERMGDLDGAVVIYHDLIERMERKEPAAEAQLAIARLYDRAGDLPGAIEQYELVKEQGTGHEAWRKASARQVEIQAVLDLREAIASEEEADPERKRYQLAEQLLEKIGDVDAALDEYATLADDAAGTEWGAKALYAQAWVYEHRLDRPDTAEALLSRLANFYNGTPVDAAARRRFGLPVWTVEELEPPPVHFIRPDGDASKPEEVVLNRVAPRDVPLPAGVTEVKVWVRVTLADDGTVDRAKVVKSGGDEFDSAALEAASASTFLGPSSGGPAVTVVQYEFPPRAKAEPPPPAEEEPLPAGAEPLSATVDSLGARADSIEAVADTASVPFLNTPVDSAAAPFEPQSTIPRLRDRN